MLHAIEIIAHRGASHDAPENTVAAARLAFQQHADAVEVDIWQTKDKQLAVIHDSTTKRTTGVTGRVGEMTLAELQKLDAGAWKSQAYAVGTTRSPGRSKPTCDHDLEVGPRRLPAVETPGRS